MVTSIESVLIRRDALTPQEATERVAECRAELHRRLEDGDMPYDICQEYFGLEPDYLDFLI